MTIFYILVIIILLGNILRKQGAISDKFFSVCICVLFVLVVGLRARSVGADTWNYYDNFYSYADYSLKQVIDLHKRDFGFFIFQWFIVHYLHNFAFLNLIAALIFYVPLTVLLYERSKDIGLSFLTLMAFTFFQFSMTGTRQTMAFGFAILAIRDVLNEKTKWWKFLFLVLIGTTFHRSCIAALVYFPIKKIAGKQWSYKLLVPMAAFFFMFRQQIGQLMILTLAPDEAYKEYMLYISGGGITTYVVFVLLLLVGIVLLRNYDVNYSDSSLYLWIFGFAVALQAIVITNSIMFRVVWYFSIVITLYLPELISSKKMTKQSQSLLNVGIYAGLLYMYFGMTIASANVVPYQFIF